VFEPVVTLDDAAVRASAAADGIFPLITNMPATEKTPLELLQIYKYQPFIEKRHEQLKTAADVAPVNFKSPERIEAFLFLYFIATIVHALVEREVRQAMTAQGIDSSCRGRAVSRGPRGTLPEVRTRTQYRQDPAPRVRALRGRATGPPGPRQAGDV
jgi:hypothetical protein